MVTGNAPSSRKSCESEWVASNAKALESLSAAPRRGTKIFYRPTLLRNAWSIKSPMTSVLALAWELDAERPETLFTFQLSGCSPGAIQPCVRSIGQPIRHPSSEGISFATGRMSWSEKKKPLSGHRDSYSCLTTQLLQSPRSITIRCYANCAPVYLSLRTSVHTQTSNWSFESDV